MANTESLPAPTPCPECGGERVQAGVSNHAFLVVNDPAKLFGQQASTLRAIVCTQCGYTRFYAVHPEKLRGKL